MFIYQHKAFYPHFITKKMEHFSFKSVRIIRVEMAKCVASYRQGKAILAVCITTEDVLPALCYYQDGVD